MSIKKRTANGSILSHDIFCSVLNRSGNDSGTTKKMNTKSRMATAVPRKIKRVQFNKTE
jgi:hypothetical protein